MPDLVSIFQVLIVPLAPIVVVGNFGLVTPEVVSILLLEGLELTDMPVNVSEVVHGDNTQIIAPEKRLQWLLLITGLLSIHALMTMLDILEAKRNGWQVLDTTLGWLSILLCRAIKTVEANHAVSCGDGQALRVGHEGERRYTVLRHFECDRLLESHSRPDFDATVTSACDKLDLLLVLSHRHTLLHVVLLVGALLHEVLRLDYNHTCDILGVSELRVVRARVRLL